jgi:hypothetical protein
MNSHLERNSARKEAIIASVMKDEFWFEEATWLFSGTSGNKA